MFPRYPQKLRYHPVGVLLIADGDARPRICGPWIAMAPVSHGILEVENLLSQEEKLMLRTPADHGKYVELPSIRHLVVGNVPRKADPNPPRLAPVEGLV